METGKTLNRTEEVEKFSEGNLLWWIVKQHPMLIVRSVRYDRKKCTIDEEFLDRIRNASLRDMFVFYAVGKTSVLSSVDYIVSFWMTRWW